MKTGLSRFNAYLVQVQLQLAKARRQKNPGLWLYQHQFRTPLFMIEGLAKMHMAIHNRKRFSKMKEHFKLLEDALGAIDYYDQFARECLEQKRIPRELTSYLQAQTREKVQHLNELLLEHGWLDAGETRIRKIREKLDSADWLGQEAEVKAISDFYGSSIYEIISFARDSKFQFRNIETDVHELRRKLRWLSIYPHAMQGSIQLIQRKDPPAYLARYRTKEVVQSPFNQLPDAGAAKHFLLLDRDRFLALSWMIATLGKLKDSGLRVIALQEAISQVEGIPAPEALAKSYNLAGKKQPTIASLLEEASAVTKVFIHEHNLEHLVAGTGNMLKEKA